MARSGRRHRPRPPGPPSSAASVDCASAPSPIALTARKEWRPDRMALSHVAGEHGLSMATCPCAVSMHWRERSGNSITRYSDVSDVWRVLRVELQVVDAEPKLNEIADEPGALERGGRHPEGRQPSFPPEPVPESARALLTPSATPARECENYRQPL